MKKFLLSIAAASFALGVYADDEVYNFFDPEDCDEQGWLWLDTQEKIDKYVGKGKKIQLIQAQYEIEDPEFPGEYLIPASSASPSYKGYNQLGEEGGEGSITGGLLLPAASYDAEEDWWPTDGGGFLVAMPDCALFEVYASQSLPEVKFEMYAAKEETDDYSACKYIWDDDPDWFGNGGPVITDYAGPYLNIQDIEYSYDDEDGNEDIWSIYGAKGEARTAYLANYSYEEWSEEDEAGDTHYFSKTCPMYIHGLHILTYTDVSMDTAVKGIEADEAVAPVYFNLQGVKVANPDKGIFIVKEGNKARKVVL